MRVKKIKIQYMHIIIQVCIRPYLKDGMEDPWNGMYLTEKTAILGMILFVLRFQI